MIQRPVARGEQVELEVADQLAASHVGGSEPPPAPAARSPSRGRGSGRRRSRPAGDEADVVGGVAGRRGSRSTGGAVGIGPPAQGEPLPTDALEHPPRRVVGVAVGEQDAARSRRAASPRGSRPRSRWPASSGPGIDHAGRVAPDDVGVRALERHRPRVRGDDAARSPDGSGSLRSAAQPATALSTASRASSGSSTTRSPTPLRTSRTSQSSEP